MKVLMSLNVVGERFRDSEIREAEWHGGREARDFLKWSFARFACA